MRQEYLSDEELLKLIEDVEKGPKIQAPRHLKSEVIGKIEKQRKTARTINIATYRLKVCVAMAASIGIFCILPFKMPSQSDRAIRSAEYRQEQYEKFVKQKEDSMKRKDVYEENIQNLHDGRDEFMDKIKDVISLDSIIGRIK